MNQEKNLQIYLCFRCGNLLFPTEKKTEATCKYDNYCFNISCYYCKKCQVNFCSYCIGYPRNFSCKYKHPIKSSSDNNKLNHKIKNNKYFCEICGKNFTFKNMYYCDICNDSYICKICSKELQNINFVKYKCNCGSHLYWRKGLYKKCDKCKIFKNCFWSCFFCKKFFCIKCYSTFHNKCGLMHELSEIK